MPGSKTADLPGATDRVKSKLLELKKDLEKKLKREVPWEEISEATGIRRRASRSWPRP